MDQHKDMVQTCLRMIGFVLHRQFGQPVPEKSRPHKTEFVLFGRRDRILLVRVGYVIDNHTLDEVRKLFDWNDWRHFDPDVFFRTELNGIADEALIFDVANSVDEGESISVIQNGVLTTSIQIDYNTYGDDVQPGWSKFPNGAFYLHTN